MQKAKNESSEKIITPIGRVRSINLAISEEDEFGSEKKVYKGVTQNTYKIELLLPKSEPLNVEFFKKMQTEELRLMQKAFNKKTFGPHPVIKDGDLEANEHLHGFYFIRARRKTAEDKPLPITLNDQKGELAAPDLFYSGCWARMQIRLKTYDFAGSKGVKVEALTLQFARHDDPLFASAVKGDKLDAIELYDAETDELLSDL
jgi:Protein of unknown function (DUF2815)